MSRRSLGEDGPTERPSKINLGIPMTANPPAPQKFYHVYILQSIPHPTRFYTGYTEDVEQRLSEHNRGKYHHTANYRPWRIKTIITFYLKTSSGRTFEKKDYNEINLL
ncbi:GIY-YIG nuclease family protein [candidate division CSSED10-310 bacterium]|uniref:GIY-YIG nuclease family protein n=1 Tax=candidate division CSSED10-310 bacterium TaxID=2855610 RepID=A0ABV6YYI4_UNCC1